MFRIFIVKLILYNMLYHIYSYSEPNLTAQYDLLLPFMCLNPTRNKLPFFLFNHASDIPIFLPSQILNSVNFSYNCFLVCKKLFLMTIRTFYSIVKKLDYLQIFATQFFGWSYVDSNYFNILLK